MRTLNRRAWASFAIVMALVCAPTSASAMEIDNEDDYYDARVWFDCGIGCGNYFEIAAGESAARRDTAGYVQVEIPSDPEFWCEDAPKVGTWQTPERADVSAGGTIKFTVGDNPDDFRDRQVRWKASQGNGVTMFWTFSLKAFRYDEHIQDGCWAGTA